MTRRFLDFIPFILKWETEFNKDGSVRVEHDPSDPGGTTKYGIDARSHPHENIANLTRERALAIYYDEWSGSGIDPLPAKFGEVFFNARVNCGFGRAKKIQARLINFYSAPDFLIEQVEFYKRLVAGKPAMQKYLRGWLNRVDALRVWLRI